MRDQCETLSNPQQVQELLHKVIAAKSEKEVEQHFLDLKAATSSQGATDHR